MNTASRIPTEISNRTQVSPSADLALRKHVERAVRPLAATEERKLRIREELYVHLLGIYQSERQRLDETTAVAAACKRFGEPAELNRELKVALPLAARLAGLNERYERALDRFWSQGPTEPLRRYVVRSVASIALLTFVLTFGIVGSVRLIGGGPDDESTWTMLAKLFPLIVLGESSAVFAAVAVERLTARYTGLRRWLTLAVHGAFWSALLMLATAASWWWISGRPFSNAEALSVGLRFSLAISALLFAIALACDYTRRRKELYDTWRLLPIDE